MNVNFSAKLAKQTGIPPQGAAKKQVSGGSIQGLKLNNGPDTDEVTISNSAKVNSKNPAQVAFGGRKTVREIGNLHDSNKAYIERNRDVTAR